MSDTSTAYDVTGMTCGHCESAVREEVSALVRDDDFELLPLASATPHLPFEVADYVDFYCSEHHAAGVGRLYRPDAEPLLPNWRHLPVGYHGRASTVVTSGTPVRRPQGQLPPPEPGAAPRFGPSERLDMSIFD